MWVPWRNFSANGERSRRPPRWRSVWLAARNNGGNRVTWRVHGDPMVGEDEVRLRRNPWHVAPRAGFAGDVHTVTWSGMAFPAGGVIGRKLRLERGMRRVTRQTRHASAGGSETVAGRQHHRLMARVPGVLEICRIPLYTRHAVALAAEIVELGGIELSRISGTHLCGVFYVVRSRPVTRLAPNSRFVGRDYLVGRDLQGARGVTTEAAKDSCLRVKDPVLYSTRVLMTRRKSSPI